MIETAAVLLPLLFAGAVFLCGHRVRLVRCLLPTLGTVQLALLAILDFSPAWNRSPLPEWIAADSLSMVVATVTGVLFFCASLHAAFWLPATLRYEAREGAPMRENVFCALLCLFLSTMMLVVFSRNYGLLWVAVEATTLTSAVPILFHRSAGSLEAMWKYLLICSVGIGLALFGTFLLGVAVPDDGGAARLGFDSMALSRARMAPAWFKAAFLFCFAGYGLKMGLAPFHTWLPDAHSEAPALVSVLLSGALLNCSFLGIVRVLAASPEALLPFCRELLVGFGMFSLLTAAFFVIRQSDYKRMLAYSSVEHMGLLAVLWGLDVRDYALIHLCMHSLCKMLLFLVAGNILLAWGTRKIEKVGGLFGVMPLTATLWLTGVLMICGVPPSPLFVTELKLVLHAGPWLGGIVLLLLFMVFCGMTSTAVRMTMGDGAKPDGEAVRAAERLSLLPAALMPLPIIFGIYLICVLTGVF